jgi:hypothetical protein
MHSLSLVFTCACFLRSEQQGGPAHTLNHQPQPPKQPNNNRQQPPTTANNRHYNRRLIEVMYRTLTKPELDTALFAAAASGQLPKKNADVMSRGMRDVRDLVAGHAACEVGCRRLNSIGGLLVAACS